METEKTIGKYKILHEIGKGGMAIVYKALELQRQKVVALKVLLPSMVDRSTVERFSREAQAMARLDHPNIIKIYDFGMVKGNHYFAMEFIEGESLKSMIKHKGPFSVEQGLDIITQVGQALAYAHNEGMIHRDIKPGNIMVTRDGRVKVMDFGLVQIPGVTRVTAEGQAVGTAEYMSPEQISDQEVDSRSDIYSLGATIYEIFTGHPPFAGDTFQAVLMKHKYEAPPPMRELYSQIPPELERITQKAMAKDIAQRYQKAQEILDDINRLRAGRPQAQKQAPAFKQESKAKPKKKIAARITGVIVIGLLAFWGYRYKDKVIPQKEADLIRETQGFLSRLELAEEYHNRGLEFYQDGLLAEAIVEYKKAIDLRADYGLYYSNLAIAYEKKREYNKAIQAWRDLLRYDQASDQAEMAQEYLEKLK